MWLLSQSNVDDACYYDPRVDLSLCFIAWSSAIPTTFVVVGGVGLCFALLG